MDFNQFRAPVEVWRAAVGDTEPLAQRIRSGEPIYETEREAIALLISGNLKAPKRRKKISLPNALPTKEIVTKIDPDGLWVPSDMSKRAANAVVLYKYIIAQLKKERYGRSSEVIRVRTH